MIFKALIFLILPVFLLSNAFAKSEGAVESDQQISDFSLAGFADKGKKAWDISGKTADIFENLIKLESVVGNLYGESEDIKLTADRGDFDKKVGSVHLEQNVVITTSTGAKLTTESLDWDRKNQIVSTKDRVNIEKENMITTASGATGQPNLNKVNLEKDVEVKINNPKTKIVITCDGPLEIDYQNNIAVFKNNVKVDNQDTLIYSDIMDVYFSREPKDKSKPKEESSSPSIMGSNIEKIIARHNVKIIKGENISYSDEATYTATDKKVLLVGRPKLIIYSTEQLKGMMSLE